MAPLGDFPIADAAVAHELRYADPSFKAPEVIVVWGNEPLASNADGYIGHWLVQCVQMGSHIISIDPRLTWWGARAAYHLQLRPGTDAALACAWLNVIISEGLYDREFVDCWTSGIDELWEGVKDMTPEWAAPITGLDAEDIAGSARLYAAGNNSAIQWGLAFDQQVSAMALNLAVCDLMAICGNIDRPGGNILVRNSFEINCGYASGEEYIPESALNKKLTISRGLGMEGVGEFIAAADSDSALHVMETGVLPGGDPLPVKMMWVQSSNPVACTAMDAPRYYEALKGIDFIVDADPILTPFAVAVADVLLPVAMSCERNSARTWWTPVRTMYRAVEPAGEAKTDEQIVVDLMPRLNPEAAASFGWTKDTDIADWYLAGGDGKKHGASSNVKGNISETAKGGCGMSFQELSEKGGYAYDDWNHTYEKYAKGLLRDDGNPGFATPSGRIELAPYTYRVWGLTPHAVPHRTSRRSGDHAREDGEVPAHPVVRRAFLRVLPLGAPPDAHDARVPPLAARHGEPCRRRTLWRGGRPVGVDRERPWPLPPSMQGDPAGGSRRRARRARLVVPRAGGQRAELFGTFDSNPNNCTRAFETGEGGIGSAIKSMICRIYPCREGDVLPGVQVCERGGFGDYTVGAMRGSKVD